MKKKGVLTAAAAAIIASAASFFALTDTNQNEGLSDIQLAHRSIEKQRKLFYNYGESNPLSVVVISKCVVYISRWHPEWRPINSPIDKTYMSTIKSCSSCDYCF